MAYRVAILGAGKRGKLHAEVFHQNPRFELAALCDIDRERLDAAAELVGRQPKLYTDVAEMLSKERPDVFCFCTPPAIRLPMVKLGVEAKAKLICFEKPMAASLREGKEIRDLLRASGTKATLSHQIKYGEHFRAVERIVKSGQLGRIHTMYGTATGWYLHMVTHVIDFLRQFNGFAEAEWVVGQAVGREKLTDNHPSADYVEGTIQFQNGVRGIIEIGNLAPDVPEVEYWWHKGGASAYGTTGYAEAVIGNGWHAATKEGFQSGPGCWNAQLDQPPYVDEIADWLDDDAKVHCCNAESGYKNLEIAMGILRSAVSRQPVMLPIEDMGTETELEALNRVLP